MKEYKTLKQKTNLFSNTDKEFEETLNQYAREGWHVITAIFN